MVNLIKSETVKVDTFSYTVAEIYYTYYTTSCNCSKTLEDDHLNTVISISGHAYRNYLLYSDDKRCIIYTLKLLMYWKIFLKIVAKIADISVLYTHKRRLNII